MIPKRELRIGNWVTNKEGNFFKIRSGAFIDAADSFAPIELNKEILSKCGFSLEGYFKLWQKKQALPETGFLLEMDQDFNVKDFSQKYIGVRLTSLHQLQNLLFELKRVEIDFEVVENLDIQDISAKVENILFKTLSSN